MNLPLPLTRRTFLRRTALTAGLAAVTGPLLDACGSGGGGGTIAGGGVPLPDYVPALKVKPDLPGTAAGIQDGFTSAVKNYLPSVTGPIGNGGDVRSLLITYTPPPPPVEQNTWWQAVNKRTNVNFRAEIAAAADYPTKFASVVAGGNLPDLVQVPLFINLPRLPDLLGAQFQDLSDLLSGANVREYPNLAGIPTYSWNIARIKGRIYGVPLSRPVIYAPLLIRQDILDQVGATRPTDATSFEALCKELTNAPAGRWALGSDTTFMFDLPFFAQMFGAPVRWGRKPDGSLVKDYETDQFAAAVEYARKLRAAGYFHPDAGSISQSQVKDQFGAGKIVMYNDGPSGWKSNYDIYAPATPGINIDAMVPFAANGGPTPCFLDRPAFSITAIKKADPERVKELLRLLNYFAAPYGSMEYLLNTSGVQGVDYTMNPVGLPTLTTVGKAEQGVGFFYVMSPPQVLADPDHPDFVKQAHTWQSTVVPRGVSDPTDGYYSDTASRTNAQLEQAMGDALRNIISGRGALADLKPAVDAWRNGGGDRIRKELQDAIAAAPR